MSCCTETKYNLFIRLTQEQKLNLEFQTQLRNKLQQAMGWSLEQANQAVNWAANNETFLIAKDVLSVLTKLSQKLAQFEIPHQMKLAK